LSRTSKEVKAGSNLIAAQLSMFVIRFLLTSNVLRLSRPSSPSKLLIWFSDKLSVCSLVK